MENICKAYNTVDLPIDLPARRFNEIKIAILRFILIPYHSHRREKFEN